MICQIVTLYMLMVAESFGSRPSPRDWSNLVFSKNKSKNRDPLLGMVKFVLKFVFFWNPNEISVFIFTYLLLR